MPKTSTDLLRHALNGPVMGTRWSAVFYAADALDVAPVKAALATELAKIDQQMSTWKPDSDLMRINAAELGVWLPAPDALLAVLEVGLAIGEASDGAFDVGLGDVVRAWGFSGSPADPSQIIVQMKAPHPLTQDVLQLDRPAGRLRKLAPVTLDLSGIAKGYAVDRMSETLSGFGVEASLTALDGELRGSGLQPDGTPWAVALERPDYAARAALSMLGLHDAAVATSGDYRHWLDVGGKRLSHTMDRARGAPVDGGPASVTVMAASCIEADAWATALLVKGVEAGSDLARRHNLNALFLTRSGDGFEPHGVGFFA